MARREVLHRRVRLIVAATITYNIVEAIIALTAGCLLSRRSAPRSVAAEAEHFPVGIVLAAVSPVIMPSGLVLGRSDRRPVISGPQGGTP